MNQQLRARLRVYEQEGIASPEIVNLVRAVLLWLEDISHYPVTEESAGALASHLMLALMRIQQGETLASAWNPDVHEEAMQLTFVFLWAEHIRGEVRHVLGLILPSAELDFLLLHLGTFVAYYDNSLL